MGEGVASDARGGWCRSDARRVHFGTKEISESILWPGADRLHPEEQRSSHNRWESSGAPEPRNSRWHDPRCFSIDCVAIARASPPLLSSLPFPTVSQTFPHYAPTPPLTIFPSAPPTLPSLFPLFFSCPLDPIFFYIHIRIYIKIHIYFQTGNLGARRHAQGLRGFACYA